jgi:hypothetical protein
MIKSGLYLLIIPFILAQCGLNFKRGNGNIDRMVYDLKEFRKLFVGGNYDLRLVPSDVSRVVIETDQNLMRYINVELHDGSLNINNVYTLKGSRGIVVEVYYQTVEQVHSTGNSKISHEGILEAENLRVGLSGAGAIDLEINTDKVQVDMSGAGVVELRGKTRRQETHISGAGGLVAENLISEECYIHLSGLGGASVYVSEKLEASITGIGGITYAGRPNLVEKQITGLGKIQRNENYIEEEDVDL